ncbi:hypothetical protein ACVWWN_000665 [Mycobacterium sp. URHB0021]|jgi:hypothetical protein
MIVASIVCEIVGSVVLGIVLLVFHRVNPVSTCSRRSPAPCT